MHHAPYTFNRRPMGSEFISNSCNKEKGKKGGVPLSASNPISLALSGLRLQLACKWPVCFIYLPWNTKKIRSKDSVLSNSGDRPWKLSLRLQNTLEVLWSVDRKQNSSRLSQLWHFFSCAQWLSALVSLDKINWRRVDEIIYQNGISYGGTYYILTVGFN